MKIVSAAEMREIDRLTTDKYGVPSLTLMETAGTAASEFILEQYPLCNEVCIFCGKGNNGGDGFVIARKLAEQGKNVEVILLAAPEAITGDAAVNLSRLPSKPLVFSTAAQLHEHDLGRYDLLVDAILGTGFKPPVSDVYAEAIRTLNHSGIPILAIDLPSGAETDARVPAAENSAVVRPDSIVTFTALKPAHVFQFPNVPTVVRQIGTPPEAINSSADLNLITPEDISSLFLSRKPDAHKGDFGHVLVVGASVGKAGAAAMAGMSALRAGAGLVTVATPRSMLPVVAGFAPEIMTIPMAEGPNGAIGPSAMDDAAFQEGLQRATVLAVGPGISRLDSAPDSVRRLVSQTTVPLVLDADGLNAFEGRAHEIAGQGRILVLTPHPGEMSRLLGVKTSDVQKDRVELARRFAREHGVYLVLKGYLTVVATPTGRIWINTQGNPGMATGGTGDILTGIIAGLLAQHPQQPETCVIAGVFLHGASGTLARDQMGEMSLTATDLLLALPQAIQDLSGADAS
jgi:NAD(P)H-hydrate epimerase